MKMSESRDRAFGSNPGPRAFTPGYEGNKESAIRLYAEYLRSLKRVSIYPPSPGGGRLSDRAAEVLLRALVNPRDSTPTLARDHMVSGLNDLVCRLEHNGWTVTQATE